MRNRAEDVRIEQVCGKFLDENFYSKISPAVLEYFADKNLKGNNK